MSRIAISLATALFAVTAHSPALAASPETVKDHDAMMTDMYHCGLPSGVGVINGLDIEKSQISVTHEPIESIGWPEMKMDFTVLKPVDLAAFTAGERVHFLLKPENDKSYSISAVCSLDIEADAHEACMSHMHNIAMKAATDSGRSCDMDGVGDMTAMDHSGHGDETDETQKGHH
ncbi:MAG: copper-binding protein [Parvularculaceae bacterium]